MSAARERAVRAVMDLGPAVLWSAYNGKADATEEVVFDAHSASLDENDAALVEAIEAGIMDALDRGGHTAVLSEDLARAAIIAARRHITGEGA